MDFTELDRELTSVLNLEEGCVFIMRLKKSEQMFEFLYPSELKGFKIPVLNHCIAGKAATHKSPFVSNNSQGEMDVADLNCKNMNRDDKSTRRTIAYPICLASQLCAVLLVVRNDHGSSDLQNFPGEDLIKIKSVVDNMIYLQLVKTA
jgi:hypothetical protein